MGAKTAKPPKKPAPAPPAEVRAPLPPAVQPEEFRGSLPLARLRPSPENPRKTFEDLDGLAASMREHGVLQPLLVRPIGPAPRRTAKGWDGVDWFEVVAGERRLRAAALAGLAEVPVTVRVLTDAQARPLRHVENEQRADVRLSETAAAYAKLAESMTDAEVAAAVGKPLGYVRGLVRLARLPAWALAAVDAGTLSRATAELVARVPGEESRKRAAACVVWSLDPAGEWDAEKQAKHLTGSLHPTLSFREAKELIATHFTRQLKGSPFSLKLADLVPAAGSCDACPKRAGNDAEAKADGVRADVCLDPDCYRGKVEAADELERVKFRKRFRMDADADVNPDGAELRYGIPVRGWLDWNLSVSQSLDLRAELPRAMETRKVSEVVLECPVVHGCGPCLVFDQKHKPHVLVKMADVRKTLIAAGVLKKPERKPAAPKAPPPARSPLDRMIDEACGVGSKPAASTKPLLIDEQPAEEKAAEIGARVLGEMAAGDCGDVDAAAVALRQVARFLIRDHCEFGPERRKYVAVALGFDPERAPSGDMLYHEAAGKLAPADVLGLCVRLAAAPVLDGEGGAARGFGYDLLEWGQLDWPQLLDQARRELAGEPTADERLAAAEAAQVAEPVIPPTPVVLPQLLDLDVPAAVLDLLDTRQLHGVAETWAACQEETPEITGLPPRNRLMAWLVKLGAKAGKADQAAGVIAGALPDEGGEGKVSA